MLRSVNTECYRDAEGMSARDMWAFTPKIVDASSSQSSTIRSRRTKSVFSTAFTKIDDVIGTHFNASRRAINVRCIKSFRILHNIAEIPKIVCLEYRITCLFYSKLV